MGKNERPNHRNGGFNVYVEVAGRKLYPYEIREADNTLAIIGHDPRKLEEDDEAILWESAKRIGTYRVGDMAKQYHRFLRELSGIEDEVTEKIRENMYNPPNMVPFSQKQKLIAEYNENVRNPARERLRRLARVLFSEKKITQQKISRWF